MACAAIVEARKIDESINIFGAAAKLKMSRSTVYYNRNAHSSKDARDEQSVKPVRELFEQKKKKVGIRQLQMLLGRKFKLRMNRKKIARLKKKFGLITMIRRKSSYSSFRAADREHRMCANVLDRRFNPKGVDRVYSADITELKYSRGRKKSYLAAFKDLATKEIVSYEITKIASVELVIKAFKKAVSRINKSDRAKLIIHTDQGFHFTSYAYRSEVAESGIIQSMSRKGNCLDNAPIESFFGYLKDHLELDQVESFEKLREQVRKEIDYYNFDRPQIGLNGETPAFRRKFLCS